MVINNNNKPLFYTCSNVTVKTPTWHFGVSVINSCFSEFSLLIPVKISENPCFFSFSGGSKGNIGKKKINSFNTNVPILYSTPFDWFIFDIETKLKPWEIFYVETSQLICIVNQLTGFFVTGTLIINGLTMMDVRMLHLHLFG